MLASPPIRWRGDWFGDTRAWRLSEVLERTGHGGAQFSGAPEPMAMVVEALDATAMRGPRRWMAEMQTYAAQNGGAWLGRIWVVPEMPVDNGCGWLKYAADPEREMLFPDYAPSAVEHGLAVPFLTSDSGGVFERLKPSAEAALEWGAALAEDEGLIGAGLVQTLVEPTGRGNELWYDIWEALRSGNYCEQAVAQVRR